MSHNLSLFSEQLSPKLSPLADRLRPTKWDEFEGSENLDSSLLLQLKQGKGRPPSLLLWGPPGSGKTTLARLIGNSYNCKFIELSSVLTGVKEIRDLAEIAKMENKVTILFVDEIHRLNKSQQDIFLPYIEKGIFNLIGATTENPSFYLTSALLSRARVLVLNPLTPESLTSIAKRCAQKLEFEIPTQSLSILISSTGGDARKLLNLIEALIEYKGDSSINITDEDILSLLKDKTSLFYDRSGEEHYNMASAFIKSLRGSDPDAALYWCFRMIESGEDPLFLIRRMIIFASEDIGNADPSALPLTVATSQAFERLGRPEGYIPIAQCVTYLACAYKSNRSYEALQKVRVAIKEHPKVSVPIHLRNAPTALMGTLGYGKDYLYPHCKEEGYVTGETYLPEELKGRVFYNPSERGKEIELKLYREKVKDKT